MKHFKIFLFLVILAGTVLIACKKNNELNISGPSGETKYTEYEWMIYHKLNYFENKLNSSLRDEDPVSLDSAEWYMESNFNVDEAYTEDPFRLTRRDTTYYTLPLNKDSMVEYSDMNTMYNQMLSDLDSLEILIADPYVFPVVGVLELESTNGNEAYFSLVIAFGSNNPGNYEPITTSDNWRFGNMNGHCDPNIPGNSDAGQELINRLNDPLFAWTTPGSFINNSHHHILYDEYEDVNNQNPDPDVGHMIFYEITTTTFNGNGPCIEYDELNFYLDRIHEILYTYENQNLPNTTTLYGKRPVGKSFVPGSLEIWTPSGGSYPEYWWEHRFWMDYGERVNIPPSQ